MFGYQKSVKKAWFILNKIVNNTCPQLKTKKLWNSLKLYNWVKYFDREIKFVTFTRIKNIFAMLRFKVSTVYFLVFKVTAIDWNFANIRLNQGIIKLFLSKSVQVSVGLLTFFDFLMRMSPSLRASLPRTTVPLSGLC